MERVRRETALGSGFERASLERALARFVELYGVRPLRATCAPDVLARACELGGAHGETHRHSLRAEVDGVPLVAAVLAPGTIVFEGEVDEERMGDW